MSLPHVLLGLLAEEPCTGYDLARRMTAQLEPVWRSRFSQIYPALARLRRAGFVALRVLGPRRGPRRNLYRVTAAGRRELRRWLTAAPEPPRSKDEGLVRVALLGALGPPDRHLVLRLYERAISEELRRLRAAPDPSGFLGEARRGAIERLEATRRWLRPLSRDHRAPGAARAAGSGGGKRK
jgi:DNA-binding PadR family transcriptional regulator